MDYVEKLNIRDVLYLIHDLELRNSINKVSIEDDDDQLVAANVLYSRFQAEKDYTDEELALINSLKLNKQVFYDFLNYTLAKVATTNDYNDLDNLPDLNQFKGGPTVEGTALVFDSASEGLTPYEYEQLLAILGSGEIR